MHVIKSDRGVLKPYPCGVTNIYRGQLLCICDASPCESNISNINIIKVNKSSFSLFSQKFFLFFFCQSIISLFCQNCLFHLSFVKSIFFLSFFVLSVFLIYFLSNCFLSLFCQKCLCHLPFVVVCCISCPVRPLRFVVLSSPHPCPLDAIPGISFAEPFVCS